MAGSKNNSANKGGSLKTFHLDREIVPVRPYPKGTMAARYKDDEFSAIQDQQGRPIPFKNL